MIVYDKLWKTMKEKGVSTYVLREKYNFNTNTIKKMRTNGNLTVETLNKLCTILDCKLEEIAEYIPEKE